MYKSFFSSVIETPRTHAFLLGLFAFVLFHPFVTTGYASAKTHSDFSATRGFGGLKVSMAKQTRKPKTKGNRKAVKKAVPSDQGLLVETMDGQVVQEQRASDMFHPASTIKIATALFALRTLGPNFVYETTVSTDGTVDAESGTVRGDLFITSKDPFFRLEHGVALAKELNKLGIKRITGRLIVSPGFTMASTASAASSAALLSSSLDASRRSCKAVDAFLQTTSESAESFSVETLGGSGSAPAPANLKLILMHKSPSLREILKVMLCYSDNFMAEKIGAILGGPKALKTFLVNVVQVPTAEVRVSSTSGLGSDSVTPRAMMKILRAMVAELKAHELALPDLLPVAGVDVGTLQKRFTAVDRQGTVSAKTGTHYKTQGGVSALVGETQTRKGVLLFVILDRRGNVPRFREKQDELIASIQDSYGGAFALPYERHNVALALRLAPCSELKSRHS